MNEPRLYVGGLSGRVFCTTDYIEHAGTVRANTKHDVTDDFERVALELGWVAPPTEGDDEPECPFCGQKGRHVCHN